MIDMYDFANYLLLIIFFTRTFSSYNVRLSGQSSYLFIWGGTASYCPTMRPHPVAMFPYADAKLVSLQLFLQKKLCELC